MVCSSVQDLFKSSVQSNHLSAMIQKCKQFKKYEGFPEPGHHHDYVDILRLVFWGKMKVQLDLLSPCNSTNHQKIVEISPKF